MYRGDPHAIREHAQLCWGFCLPGRCRHNKDDWISPGGSHVRLVRGTVLGTSTIIQCYPLVRAFLYPQPEDARGCQRVPARCPRHIQS